MHLRAVSHLIRVPRYIKIMLNIAYIRFHSSVSGVNEFKKASSENGWHTPRLSRPKQAINKDNKKMGNIMIMINLELVLSEMLKLTFVPNLMYLIWIMRRAMAQLIGSLNGPLLAHI